VSNEAKLNEELDPQLMIARLKQEISRLKAELAIARGEAEGYPDGLPDYEKERVKIAVSTYVKDSTAGAELVFSDFTKIQHAFVIMKEWILSGGQGHNSNLGGSQINVLDGSDGENVENYDKLRQLISHRDNEISIFPKINNRYTCEHDCAAERKIRKQRGCSYHK
jgi:kinesin family member 6/9